MPARRDSATTSAALLAANFWAATLVIWCNKHVFVLFPYPAALTAIHYFVSWAGVEGLLAAGVFRACPVPLEQRAAFRLLVVCWSACNALSNISLERNSVGFYQLAKLMVSPALDAAAPELA